VAVAFAIAIAWAALGADLRVDAGIRMEGRSRTNETRGLERVTTADVSTTARAALELVAPDFGLRALYTPTLRAPDVLTSTRPDVLHVAELRAQLRMLPTWSIVAAAAGQRGTTDLLAETRRRGTAPEAVPTTAQLRYASAGADVTLEGTADPRTTVRLTAGFSAGGGDDAASRALLPFERAVRAAAMVDWSATRRDVISAQGGAVAARFTGDREAGLALLTAGWRHQIDRTIAGRVRAGATASHDDTPSERARRTLVPSGEVGVAHAFERLHTAEDLAVRIGMAVDRVRGTVDPQLEAEASTRWSPTTTWSLAGRAVAALVRQDAGDARRGSLEVRVDWGVSRQTSVGLGLYGQWQRSPDPLLPSFVEGGAFGSFAFDLRRGR